MSVLVLVWLISSGFTNAEPHLFTREQCLECHLEVPVGDGRKEMKFVSSINELCKACHSRVEAVSHSLCVVPSFDIRTSIPLEKGCGVTCATCHDPHMPAVDPVTMEKTHYLRGDGTGTWHCGICHKTELSRSDRQTHRPSMDSAHGYSHYTVLFKDESLDRLTLMCLSCHDAPDAPEPTKPGSSAWRHASNTFIPHQVGVDYEEAAWRNPDLKLKTRDESLPLFGGRIGCCTCHDPYRPGGGVQLRLGTVDDTEPLCRGCHLNR